MTAVAARMFLRSDGPRRAGGSAPTDDCALGYRLGGWRGIFAPVIAARSTPSAFESAFARRRGAGGAWTGRRQAAGGAA